MHRDGRTTKEWIVKHMDLVEMASLTVLIKDKILLFFLHGCLIKIKMKFWD